MLTLLLAALQSAAPQTVAPFSEFQKACVMSGGGAGSVFVPANSTGMSQHPLYEGPPALVTVMVRGGTNSNTVVLGTGQGAPTRTLTSNAALTLNIRGPVFLRPAGSNLPLTVEYCVHIRPALPGQ